MDAHKNFARSTIATPPSPATSGTSLAVDTGEGDRFPAVPFNATVKPVGVDATPENSEIIRVTGRTADTFTTIVRAQESSTARGILAGDQIVAGVSSKTLTDIEDAIASILAGGMPMLTADPASPANDTWWAVRTGTTPTMTVAVKFRYAGATYTIASVTM